ncbi:MAG TPA: hypothetical protein VKB51_00015 [bacterium]|nr:hypothetical protein [bacterium]
MTPGFTQTLVRSIVMLLLLGLFAMIVYGTLFKETLPSDVGFWLPRWPFWVAVGVGGPLLVLRLVLWRWRGTRRKAADPTPPVA